MVCFCAKPRFSILPKLLCLTAILVERAGLDAGEQVLSAEECLPGMTQKRSARQVLRECSGDPIDLYDYTCLRRSRAMRAPHEASPPIIVTDDWPQEVPITDPELRVIEGHLAEELDKLLGPRA
jgi:hypothetical protein